MQPSGKIVLGASAAAWVALAASGLHGRRIAALERQRLDERLTALSLRMPLAERGPGGEDPLEAAVRALEARLTRMEGVAQRTAVPLEAVAPAPRAASSTDLEGPAPAAPRPVVARDELEALLDGLVRGGGPETEAGAAAMERFLALARQGDALDEWIDELEALVGANPRDPKLRMDLADLYTGKLLTVGGPEQGVWGGKAEREWQAVVALDDDHLRAHAALGTNYAYYPDVMGKTDDAIHHLERARELQRALQPSPEHVQTYLFLARMYQRTGEAAKAREVLQEGLGAHPGEPALVELLGRL